jgi:AcrR family transcriptional regulator
MSLLRKKRESKAAHGLTRERIAEAALALIAARGRASLSMRSLAAELGCEAMSLYHHVDGIEGVLDAVVDRLLGSIVTFPREAGNPRKALEAFAKAFLGLAETYPDAFPLVPTRLFRTATSQATVSLAIALYREMGLRPRAALRQARVLGAYLGGAGLALAAWRKTGTELTPRMQAAAQDDAQLKALARNVNASDVRADIDAGLKQILDGARGES